DFRAGVNHHGRAAAAVSAGDEHFTVLEKCRRVALAWRAQAAGCCETTRSRIVQLRAGEKRPSGSYAAGQQDSSVLQNDRRVSAACRDHRSGCREASGRRIVQLRGVKVISVVAASDHYLSI